MKELDPDPFIQFDKWYNEHLTAGFVIPDSVALATSFSDGRVSLRTVLLKYYSEKGFIFFTNYESKKGIQLVSNPFAALLFYWPESARQVRVEGKVEKTTEEESLAYFQTRPRESQLSAWASMQSSVITDRNTLQAKYDSFNKLFEGKKVDKPPYWGGFRIIPQWFEFWQEGEFRMHDRFSYKKTENGWKMQRLSP
jgi:pyridoxamine 5'-phosphate oxidase